MKNSKFCHYKSHSAEKFPQKYCMKILKLVASDILNLNVSDVYIV